MPAIEGIRICNFKTLKEVTLGRVYGKPDEDALTALTVVIGHNGAGKSSLFDAFGFLADCLQSDVEAACDARGRGGYDKLHSLGQDGPISFTICYKQDSKSRPITYELSIDKDTAGRPYVAEERLRQRRQGAKRGRPLSFLWLKNGEGVAWKGQALATDEQDIDLSALTEEGNEVEHVKLSNVRQLGIASLASLRQHPRITQFRDFMAGWYLSYFQPNAARELPMAGAQPHLSSSGNNLGNVVQYMEREHPKKLEAILQKIASRIPGISRISTRKTEDSRLLLCFNDKGFTDPFYAQQMSDGTLKLFSYLLLLEDPNPRPFICIEEPENGLYSKLLDIFITELRERAKASGKSGFQAFITTHQPYLLDALKPEEVWLLKKGEDGFSTLRRVSENATVKALWEEELPLGGLWASNYLDD